MKNLLTASLMAVALESPLFAEILVMTDGTQIEVASFEVKGGVVVFTTAEGKLQSVPTALVDIETTERLNQQGTGETVSLRFHWSKGMTAAVESTYSRERNPSDAANSLSGSGKYTLSVADHADGLLVHYHDFEVGPLDASTPSHQRIWKALAGTAASYVVDREGVFVRLEDPSRMKAEIDRLLEPLWADVPEAQREQTRSLLDRLLTEQTLTASAADDWNALVGAWVGAEFEVGQTYVLATASPLPAFPDVSLPMRHEFLLSGWVPCDADGTDSRCVQLRGLTFPDPEGLKALVEKFLKGVGVGESGEKALSSLQFLDVRTEVILVAEPDGLVPHSLELIKDIRASSGPQGTDIQQIERRTMHFQWQR